MIQYKSKLRIYVFLAWLYARLRWGIQWTRLSMATMIPKARIHAISHQPASLKRIHWLHEDNQFTVIGFKAEQDRLIVRRLNKYSNN